MGLEATIKELKEKIAEEEKNDLPDSEGEEGEKEVVEEPEQKEEKKEEPAAEEKKPEEVKEEELDNNGWRRLRREKAAAEKLAQDMAAENAELKAKLSAPREEDAVETPAADPEIEQIVHDHRVNRAEKEFVSLESKFAEANPDYHDVSNQYALALAQSIKIQNPRLSNSEVAEKTKEAILLKASGFVNKGFDPIEELYHEAKELGFKKREEKKPEPKEEAEEEIKPDMKKVSVNRSKSTGMTATSGESKGQLTKAAAADLSVDEWKRLPKEEKKRLMYG